MAKIGRAFDRLSRLAPGLLAAIGIYLSLCPASAQTAHFSGAQRLVASGLDHPQGLAVDASGNVFVANYYGQSVQEILAVNGIIPASPTVKTLGSGFAGPTAVAVDGNGDVFVADYASNTVKEMVAVSGSIPASPAILTLGSGFYGPQGVAVDVSGDVFVADYLHNQVKEMVAVSGSIPATNPTISVLASGFNRPFGLALDANGDLFVADSGNWAVKEILAPAYTTVNTLGSGFDSPAAVAVDASGNVFVADSNNYATKEILASGGYTTVEKLGCCGYPPMGVATDARGNVFVADADDGDVSEFNLSGVNFGTVNVGTASSVQYFSFTFETAGSAGSAAALTGGAAGQDFAITSDFCTDQIPAGEQCELAVTFTPTHPGTRYGAVELLSTSGTLLATGYAYGMGLGPHVAYPAGKQSTLGSGFSWPDSVAVDGSGNVFVTDKTSNAVKEILASGGYVTINTLGSGFNHPVGVAVDGGGNVFVADNGNNAVKEILAVGGYATTNTLGGGFSQPEGVTVDGNGNVYVADGGNSAVKQILAVNGSIPSSPTIRSLGSGWNWPEGLAVDGSGNVFVADYYNSTVREMLAVNGVVPASPTIDTLGGGFSELDGVALDANENIYVADTGNSAVKEILAAGGYRAINTLISSIAPLGVAVDANGNVFTPGNYQVLKLDVADAPSLTFPATSVGQTSAAQTVTVENNGNATLSFAVPNTGDNPSIGENFTLNSSGESACPLVAASSSTPGTLAVGAQCQLSISFAPTETGNISGWLVMRDNALNAAGPAYTTQSIELNSTAAPEVLPPTLVSNFSAASIPLNTTVVQTFNIANPNATITLTGVGFLESLPAGLVVATGNTNTCGGTLTATSGASSIGLTGVTLAGTESCTVTATLTGTAAGVQTVATSVSSIEGGAGNSGNLSVTVVAPPVITAAFSPASITVNGVAGLTFNLTNNNTGTWLTGVGFTATLPSGLQTAQVNAQLMDTTDVCQTGTATMSGGTFTLTGGRLPSLESCSITIYVTGAAVGQASITTSTVASNKGGVSGTASAVVQVAAPPIFTVTTTTDDVTGVAANCTDQSQPGATLDTDCSLRDAIAQAWAAAQEGIGGELLVARPMGTTGGGGLGFGSIVPTVNFAPALTAISPAAITLGSGGALNIAGGMSIVGPGANLLSISGANLYQVFSVTQAQGDFAMVAISGLTITAGNAASGSGGGINNQGILSLSNAAVTNSAAANGGGINNEDMLTLTNVTLSGNSATAVGGGLANSYSETTQEIIVGDIVLGYNTNFNYGSVTVVDSTIVNNSSAGGLGGGIYNAAEGVAPSCPGPVCTTTESNGMAPDLLVVNSTITGNSANSGGGIYNLSPVAGNLTVTDATITGNSAANGGGVDLAAGALTFQNDIVTGNTASTVAPDFTGTTADGGGNVLGQSSGTGTSTGANLAALGSYGGSTQTMPPIPANSGTTPICAGLVANIPTGIATDQRGNPRSTTAYGTTPCVDSGAVQTAYSLGFTTQPSTAQLNATLSSAPVVQLYDNATTIGLSGAPVTVTLAEGTLSGTATVATDSNGRAAFSGLSVAPVETGDTLTASAPVGGSTIQVVSAPFNVIALDHFTVAAPVQVAPGVAFSVTATAIDSSGNLFTAYNGTIHFSANCISANWTAILPNPTTLTSGAGSFNATLHTNEACTLSVADTVDTSATGSSGSIAMIAPTITVAPQALPAGTAETAFSQQLSASGGLAPYSYLVTIGSLPTGITLSPSGLLSGTPTVAGSFPFTATATDADWFTGSQNYTLVINLISQTIIFTPPTPVTFGVAPIALSATGGASGNPVTFSLVSGPASLSGNLLTITGAGTVKVMASQAGTSIYAPGSLTQPITVNKATPAVTVGSNTNPVAAQNTITLTATVSSAAGTPTGSVNFLSGTTQLGSGQLSGSGVATLTTTALTTGSDSITASYSGDTNFNTFTSSALTEVVEDFSVAISGPASSSSVTVAPGSSAGYAFAVAPLSPATTFPAAISFSVGGLPAGATYKFSPATLAEGAEATTVGLSIQLPQTTLTAQSAGGAGGNLASRLASFSLGLLLLPFAGRLRRGGKRLGRAISALLLLTAAIAVVTGLNGCGSTSGFFVQTQQGYTVTMTGSSGALSHSATVTLTVEQ